MKYLIVKEGVKVKQKFIFVKSYSILFLCSIKMDDAGNEKSLSA